jgi:hypothetical protein
LKGAADAQFCDLVWLLAPDFLPIELNGAFRGSIDPRQRLKTVVFPAHSPDQSRKIPFFEGQGDIIYSDEAAEAFGYVLK